MKYCINQDRQITCQYLSSFQYMPATKHEQIARITRKMFGQNDSRIFVKADKRKNLQYLIFEFRDTKQVFVSIRGTDNKSIKEGIKDLIISMQVWPRTKTKENEKIKFHNGYQKYGEKLLNQLKEDLEKHEDYEIYFCGHSLGGALQQYMTLHYNSLVPDAKKVECYSFGSPRIGYHNDKEYNIINFVDVTDPVPLWTPFHKQNSNIIKIGNGVIPKLSSHSIENYIRKIRQKRNNK